MQSTLRLLNLMVAIAGGLALVAQERALPVLQYVDGNGNSYEFSAEGSGYLLEFEPVKKGKYSGGEPTTRRVSKDSFDKVLARIDKAIKHKTSGNRERGTALIIKSVKGDLKEYILPKNSNDIKEIEALLYGLF
jgi:hypothetical protein